VKISKCFLEINSQFHRFRLKLLLTKEPKKKEKEKYEDRFHLSELFLPFTNTAILYLFCGVALTNKEQLPSVAVIYHE